MNIVRAAVAAVFLAPASGCDTIVDCLDNDGPRLASAPLEPAILNQVYAETIRASIDNEPRDDNFIYNFNISGALPEGLSTASSGRDFIFSGTPIETGTFSFTLFVEIEDEFDFSRSGLCFYSDSRRYELTVNMM